MTVVFTSGRVGKLKRSRPASFNRSKAGPITLGYITLALICVVSLCYLITVMSVQKTGYEVAALQDKITNLEDERKVLELDVAKSKSLSNMGEEKEVEKLNMVPVANFSYIGESEVASSR